MIRRASPFALTLAALIVVSGARATDGGIFPSITAADLNGREIALPAGLPAERTLLLVAYQREQQYDVDDWIAALDLRAGAIPWLELPVIRDRGWLFRTYVDWGMRTGITAEAARARVVTLYTDPEAFRSGLGLGDASTIHALVVDRTGRVLARADGRFDAARWAPLAAALGHD
jgi:hypothetical protein